jgi:hypothetical protein
MFAAPGPGKDRRYIAEMTRRRIGRRLIMLANAAWLWGWGCAPKAVSEPPPQSPGALETAQDAGLPAVPLTANGVIVPSDVKLQPGPKEAALPSGGAPAATASPTSN